MGNINLNQRLAAEIEAHYNGDMNQKRFANDCGLSEGYVSKLLNDDTNISNIRGIRELLLVADELDVSIDYLLGRTDYRRHSQEALDVTCISKLTGLKSESISKLHKTQNAKQKVADSKKSGNILNMVDFYSEYLACCEPILIELIRIIIDKVSDDSFALSQRYFSLERLNNLALGISHLSDDDIRLIYGYRETREFKWHNCVDEDVVRRINECVNPHTIFKFEQEVTFAYKYASEQLLECLELIFDYSNSLKKLDSFVKASKSAFLNHEENPSLNINGDNINEAYGFFKMARFC